MNIIKSVILALLLLTPLCSCAVRNDTTSYNTFNNDDRIRQLEQKLGEESYRPDTSEDDSGARALARHQRFRDKRLQEEAEERAKQEQEYVKQEQERAIRNRELELEAKLTKARKEAAYQEKIVSCAIKQDKIRVITADMTAGLTMGRAVKKYRSSLDLVRWVYANDNLNHTFLHEMEYSGFINRCAR